MIICVYLCQKMKSKHSHLVYAFLPPTNKHFFRSFVHFILPNFIASDLLSNLTQNRYTPFDFVCVVSHFQCLYLYLLYFTWYRVCILYYVTHESHARTNSKVNNNGCTIMIRSRINLFVCHCQSVNCKIKWHKFSV